MENSTPSASYDVQDGARGVARGVTYVDSAQRAEGTRYEPHDAHLEPPRDDPL